MTSLASPLQIHPIDGFDQKKSRIYLASPHITLTSPIISKKSIPFDTLDIDNFIINLLLKVSMGEFIRHHIYK